MTVEDCDSDRPFAAVAAHPESSALLELASKQRMNTDSRRAIFCVLMSADDHVCHNFFPQCSVCFLWYDLAKMLTV